MGRQLSTGGILCVWLLGYVVPAAADDLVSLYAEAVRQDPKLQSARFEHQADQERVPQAWADYRPVVTFDYDRVRTTQDIISSDNTVFQAGSTTFPVTTWTLSLTQPVFRYANFIRIGQAEVELKGADAKLVQAEQELMLRVAEAYFGALEARDELAFLKAERAAARQKMQLEAGRERARIGRAVDRYDAEARAASVDADYADAEVALQDAREQLYEIIGREPNALARLTGEPDLKAPEPADEDYWVKRGVENNPAVVVQRYAVEVARKEVERQNAGHYPTVDLVVNRTKQKTGGTLFGGGSEVLTQEMMLRLSVPIYAGGSVSSRKREAVARHFQAKSELTRLQREARRKIREAYAGVNNAIKRIKALKKALTAQEATLVLRKKAYRAGLETALSVLDAERGLYSVRRDLAKAKYDYLLNSLRLKARVGILTADDLQAVSRWLEG